MKNSKSNLKKGVKKKPAKITQKKSASKKQLPKKPETDLITQVELAKRLGISKQAVSSYIKAGIISLTNRKIDYTKAISQLRENTNISKIKSTKIKEIFNDQVIEDFQTSKKLKEKYKAKLAELEYKVKIQEYVKAADVEKAAFDFARKIRDKLLNVPDRITAEIQAISGIQSSRIRKIILREIEISLQGI